MKGKASNFKNVKRLKRPKPVECALAVPLSFCPAHIHQDEAYAKQNGMGRVGRVGWREAPGGGHLGILGVVCAVLDSKLAPRSKKISPNR